MPTLAYHVVDVFTDRPYAGNPLAVVLDADGLGPGQMQAMAREFNLSETVFPVAAGGVAAGGAAAVPWPADRYGVRIFTPRHELPFAGHPSIGAAWVLHRLGRLRPGRVVQECGAGPVGLDVTPYGASLTGAAPTLGRTFGRDEAFALASAVGLSGGDVVVDGPVATRRAGAGLEFTYLPVRPGALSRAWPDDAAIRALSGDPLADPVGIGAGVCLVEWGSGPFEVRVFAAPAGVSEDPATGSATLGLGVWAAACGLLGDGEHGFRVRQGLDMGRPSHLDGWVRVSAGRVTEARVTGAVVEVAVGEVAVPTLPEALTLWSD